MAIFRSVLSKVITFDKAITIIENEKHEVKL